MKALGRWLKWALLGLLGLFLVWQLWLLGWVLFWGWANPGTTRFMDIRLAELRVNKPDAVLKKEWVPYERISIHLKRAIIAAEDAKFVDHEGFDWEGIQKAMEKNQKKGRFVAGGLDHQPATGQESFPDAEQIVFSQSRRGDHYLDAGKSVEQAADFSRSISNVIEWGKRGFSVPRPPPGIISMSAPPSSGRNRLPGWPGWCPIRVITTKIAGHPAWDARPASSWRACRAPKCPERCKLRVFRSYFVKTLDIRPVLKMAHLLPQRTMSEEAQLTDTEDLQERLAEVQTLLARHKLVEELVHRQEGPRHDLVEDMVHKQHLNELQHKLEPMHPADIAYILEALPLDERLIAWDLVKAEREGENPARSLGCRSRNADRLDGADRAGRGG